MFYHDIKEHMSPSALAQWIDARSSFIKSYFRGEKSPETKAMTAGTKIHKLIEAGLIKAKCVYAHGEHELKAAVPGTDFRFLGRPDDYSDEKDGIIEFVDYKSGKANEWKEKLPTDIKMKATAWLIWIEQGAKAETVIGHIEFIPTTWDPVAKEVVPIDGAPSEVITIEYSKADLLAFSGVIAGAMNEVNEYYEKWLKSTGDFVNNEDVARYIELKKEIDERETELGEVGDRIKGQMEFGGEENHKTPAGTFFFKITEKYEYPKDLPVGKSTLESTEELIDGLEAKVKTAKQGFELISEPVSSKTTINFRPAKAEKK